LQQWNELCPGCFAVKGLKQICPYCGYDETQPRLPIALAHRSLLREEFLVGRVLGKPGGYGITYLGWDTTLLTRVAKPCLHSYLDVSIRDRLNEFCKSSASPAPWRSIGGSFLTK